MKIYVATHKKCNMPSNPLYIPLHVGAYNKENFDYLTDDTGINISNKNCNYCELTGIYWIWKNDQSNIVGLTHYRRYFFKYDFTNKYSNLLEEDDIQKLLKNFDLIVPKKYYIAKYNLFEQYTLLHNINDLNVCKEIINEKFPEYLDSFNVVMKRNYFYPYNMVITQKDNFDEYCNWLFSILFALEKRIDISSYDSYNARVFGFLSERLFNVWLEKNNKKVYECPVYNIDESIVKQYTKNLFRKIFSRIYGEFK